jgi:hypothetical protein
MSTMGRALRELKGQGPLEVMTRVMDFNVQTMQDPEGQQIDVTANTLVAFNAGSFRELMDTDLAGTETGTDVWEFRTSRPLEGGAVAQDRIYVRGEDIFMLRTPSQLAT